MMPERSDRGPRSFRREALLALATLGLYALYWNYEVHREIHEEYDLGRKGRPFRKALFFAGIVVPPLFWLYQRRFVRNLNAVRAHLGLPQDITAREFLLWEVLGSLFLVGPFLAYYRLQRSVNDVWERHEEEQAQPADVGTGSRQAAI